MWESRVARADWIGVYTITHKLAHTHIQTYTRGEGRNLLFSLNVSVCVEYRDSHRRRVSIPNQPSRGNQGLLQVFYTFSPFWNGLACCWSVDDADAGCWWHINTPIGTDCWPRLLLDANLAWRNESKGGKWIESFGFGEHQLTNTHMHTERVLWYVQNWSLCASDSRRRGRFITLSSVVPCSQCTLSFIQAAAREP